MTQRPFEIPSWAPVAALAALLVWAVSIWWMVANLETGGDTSALEGGVSTLQGEVALLATRVDALSDDLTALAEERDALSARLDELESAAILAFVDTAADSEDDATADEQHPLYTAGQDLYNCRAFASFEEAQEALRVNGPGDPNHIDSNGNGIACEDVRLPSTTASTSTSTTTQTQGITVDQPE